MTPNSEKIVFVFPSRITEGGMIDDIRHFIEALSKVHDGEILLLSEGKPTDNKAQLDNVVCVDLSLSRNVTSIVEKLTPNDITVFVTFSSFTNVRLAQKIRARGLYYTVLPAWQVNDFLDWDRPFARNAVPTVRSSEKNPGQFNNSRSKGVVEGHKTINGFFRSIKRKTFRRTLGKEFLQNAAGIHVYSSFEQEKITSLIKLDKPNFLEVSFGTNVEGLRIGGDQYPNDGRKNVVFWGRADYYYKGLDIILDAIALAKNKVSSAPFAVWICGPDYNNGYSKLRTHIERLQISDHVRILTPGDYTPGTIGLLNCADFSILASRWDGHPRALRESGSLGVPIICNPNSNFDRTISSFRNGLLFDDVHELAEILANLDGDEAKTAQINAKIGAAKFRKFFSWEECARRFHNSLQQVKRIP